MYSMNSCHSDGYIWSQRLSPEDFLVILQKFTNQIGEQNTQALRNLTIDMGQAKVEPHHSYYLKSLNWSLQAAVTFSHQDIAPNLVLTAVFRTSFEVGLLRAITGRYEIQL